MTSTDLKPGDLARHPKHPELIGTVSYDYPGVLWVNYVGSNGYRLADHDLTDWERVEVVQPGHVQIKVGDLELHGWANTSPSDRWNDEEILSHRAAKAIAAQRAESTPPADEQDARWSLPADMGDKLAAMLKAKIDEAVPDRDDANASGEATYKCPWCSTDVTFALSLNRNPRGGVMVWVAADGAHTCKPAQPDEPTEFGARVTVTLPDGTREKWLRQDDGWWVNEQGGSAMWKHLIKRGTVTIGWDE